MAEKPKAKGGPPKKKASRKLSALYTVSGERIECKNKSCPKCGAGTFLGIHNDRVVCGKCAYVEFSKK
ncbi:30S ribosomal protein S27ae [Candidatus Woesearchaeota archaeon]|nr:30S ribosomal protein S27ae [Candidatus Woesearchaeota archaeon]